MDPLLLTLLDPLLLTLFDPHNRVSIDRDYERLILWVQDQQYVFQLQERRAHHLSLFVYEGVQCLVKITRFRPRESRLPHLTRKNTRLVQDQRRRVIIMPKMDGCLGDLQWSDDRFKRVVSNDEIRCILSLTHRKLLDYADDTLTTDDEHIKLNLRHVLYIHTRDDISILLSEGFVHRIGQHRISPPTMFRLMKALVLRLGDMTDEGDYRVLFSRSIDRFGYDVAAWLVDDDFFAQRNVLHLMSDSDAFIRTWSIVASNSTLPPGTVAYRRANMLLADRYVRPFNVFNAFIDTARIPRLLVSPSSILSSDKMFIGLTSDCVRGISDYILRHDTKVMIVCTKWDSVPIRSILACRDSTGVTAMLRDSDLSDEDQTLLINDLFQLSFSTHEETLTNNDYPLLPALFAECERLKYDTKQRTRIEAVNENAYVSIGQTCSRLTAEEAVKLTTSCLEVTRSWTVRFKTMLTIADSLQDLHNRDHFLGAMIVYLTEKKEVIRDERLDESLTSMRQSLVERVEQSFVRLDLNFRDIHDSSGQHHRTIEFMVNKVRILQKMFDDPTKGSIQYRHDFTRLENQCIDRIVVAKYLNRNHTFNDKRRRLVVDSTLVFDDYVTIDQRISILDMLVMATNNESLVETLKERCYNDIAATNSDVDGDHRWRRVLSILNRSPVMVDD